VVAQPGAGSGEADGEVAVGEERGGEGGIAQELIKALAGGLKARELAEGGEVAVG
jgi:hypothetical protein